MLNVATIVTPDYINRAILLANSMNDHGRVMTHVLVVGEPSPNELVKLNERFRNKIAFYSLDDIDSPNVAYKIKKYGDTGDNLRWSLKADFALHVLAVTSFGKLLILDCDLYFVNNYDFLEYYLDDHDILLTPHWRSIKERYELILNLTHGIFNAGFVGVNAGADNFLSWWSEACKDCEIEMSNGNYVDQKYLDLVPIYFHKQTKIVRHKGCNVAIWNTQLCQRSEIDGEILIDGKFPLIFLHMSVGMLAKANAFDKAMLRYVDVYKKELEVINSEGHT